MKVLYAAHMARFDLLRAVGPLASKVTKWDEACDRRLYRLMCYIDSTRHSRMVSWVGDNKSELGPHLYADADLAGCVEASRSTYGYCIQLTHSSRHRLHQHGVCRCNFSAS